MEDWAEIRRLARSRVSAKVEAKRKVQAGRALFCAGGAVRWASPYLASMPSSFNSDQSRAAIRHQLLVPPANDASPPPAFTRRHAP